MNKEMVLSVIRHLMTLGGGALVAKGWGDAGDWAEIAGGAVAILGAAWGIYSKRAAANGANGTNATNGTNVAGTSGTTTGTLVPALLVAGLAGLLVAGCASQLEPGGAYAPVVTNAVTGVVSTNSDKALYLVDAAYMTAWKAADLVFTFELDNRAWLWSIDPNIKKSLDQVRPQAVLAERLFFKARDAYTANPTTENLASLKGVVEKLAQISGSVQAILPEVMKAPGGAAPSGAANGTDGTNGTDGRDVVEP